MMSGRVALKVDVDTLRGTLQGVPALIRLLARHQVDATFLFSLGPDHTGRALRRVFRRGFLKKVLRTSVGAHYGWKTLCYGTLLPGPNIGLRARSIMRSVRDAGFEVGVHCYDHVLWQDYVHERDYHWTRQQLERAVEAFFAVFGELPRVHGAAGWQLNEHVPRLEAEFGFQYASDTRGTSPFVPALRGAPAGCVQLPTTLPTFDEVIGLHGCTALNVAEVMLRHSLEPVPEAHVFTLHAELEGMRLLPAFERLLEQWREHSLQPCSLRELYQRLPTQLPLHEVELREIAGRSGLLACQGSAISSAPLPLGETEPCTAEAMRERRQHQQVEQRR